MYFSLRNDKNLAPPDITPPFYAQKQPNQLRCPNSFAPESDKNGTCAG